MTSRALAPSGPLRGSLRPPGDKSVSHRALLFHLLARGPTRIRGLARGEDVLATAAACRALGARVELGEVTRVVPPARLAEPDDVIDCGNSGTTLRLLAGLLAAEEVHAVLTGDASLRSRPMRRVVEPLRRLGARIDGRAGGERAPLALRGGELRPGRHELVVASAQVKSALLLAGRRAGASVREPRRSRDHTERLLRAMGAPLREERDGTLILAPVDALDPVDVDVPGDLSAAAPFVVAALLVPGSEVRVRDVGINPTRAGLLDALALMGAPIDVEPLPGDDLEPRADLIVRHGPLHGARIDGELALRCLDELPLLAVAAAFAEGETVITDAAELRVKESDRIARTRQGLEALGVAVEELPDGLVVRGGRPRGPAVVDARGDHRVAMSFAVAGLAAPGGVTITSADAVASSYPDFYERIGALCAGERA